MTRKRFVKCLMALDCPPREAEAIARNANASGLSYSEYFKATVSFAFERALKYPTLEYAVSLVLKLRKIKKNPFAAGGDCNG